MPSNCHILCCPVPGWSTHAVQTVIYCAVLYQNEVHIPTKLSSTVLSCTRMKYVCHQTVIYCVALYQEEVHMPPNCNLLCCPVPEWSTHTDKTVIYCAALYQDEVHMPPNCNLLCCQVPEWSTHTDKTVIYCAVLYQDEVPMLRQTVIYCAVLYQNEVHIPTKMSSTVLSCTRMKYTYHQTVIYCAVLYQDEAHIPPNCHLLCSPVPGWSTHTIKLSSTVQSCTRMKYTYRQTVIYCPVLYQDEVHIPPNCHLLCCPVPGWSTHTAKLSSTVQSCTRMKYTYHQTVIYCAVLYQDEVHIPPNCHLLCSPVPGWSTHTIKLSSTVQSCTRMKYTYRQTVIYCAVLYQDEVHIPSNCHLLCSPVPGWSTHTAKLSSTVQSCTRMKYTYHQTVIYCAVLYQDEVHIPPNCHLLCSPVPGWSTHTIKLSSTVLSCTRMKYTYHQTVIYCAVLYQDEVHIPSNCHLLCSPVPGWSTHTTKLSSTVQSCTRMKYTYRQTVIYCAVLYQDEVHIPPNCHLLCNSVPGWIHMPPNCHLLCSPVPGWSTHTTELSSTVLSCTRMKSTYHQTVIYCAVLYQDEVHIPPNCHLLCSPVPGWSTHATKLSSTVQSYTRMKYTCHQTVIYCAVLYQDEVHIPPNCHILCSPIPGWSTHTTKLSSTVQSCTRMKYTYHRTVIYCAVLYQDEVHIPPNCHLLCSPVPGWSTHTTKLSSTVQFCTRIKYTYHQTVIYCAVLYQDEIHIPPNCHLLCCPVPEWSTHTAKL